MICKNCNYESDRNFAFCPKCGAKNEPEQSQVNVEETTVLEPADEPVENQVEQSAPVAPVSYVQPAYTIPMPDAKKKKWPIITAIIAAVLVVLGAVAGIFWQKIEMAVLGEGAYYIKHELSTVENRIEDIFDAVKDVEDEFTFEGELKRDYDTYDEDGSEPNYSEYMKPVKDKLSLALDARVDLSSEEVYFYAAEKYDGDIMTDYLVQYNGKALAISSPEYSVSKQYVVNLDGSLDKSIAKELDIDEGVINDLLKTIVSDAVAPALEAEEPEVDSDKFNGINCTTVKFTISEESIKVLIENLTEIVEDDEDFDIVLEAFVDYMEEQGASIDDASELKDEIVKMLEKAELSADFDKEIYYTVYFDGGDVVSRQLEMKGEDETVEINTYKEDNTTNFELIVDDEEYVLNYTAENDEISGEIYFKENGKKDDLIDFYYAGPNDIKIKEDGDVVFELKGDDEIEVDFDGYVGELNYTDDADMGEIDINDESDLDTFEIEKAFANNSDARQRYSDDLSDAENEYDIAYEEWDDTHCDYSGCDNYVYDGGYCSQHDYYSYYDYYDYYDDYDYDYDYDDYDYDDYDYDYSYGY